LPPDVANNVKLTPVDNTPEHSTSTIKFTQRNFCSELIGRVLVSFEQRRCEQGGYAKPKLNKGGLQMLRKTSELQRYAIRAADGEIGKVDQFYFDDLSWVIRYLVVNTGSWLTGRKVLISPISIEKADWQQEELHLSLSREQIRNSPDIETDPPVSRQREIEYYNYHGWPYYWEGGGIWGPWPYPRNLADAETRKPGELKAKTIPAGLPAGESHDPHLRSTNEVMEYHIGAIDGEVGHLEDLLIDDGSWSIEYAVVDTRNWWPGKKVLVGLQWIDKISWTDSKVYVSLARDVLKNGPEFDPSVPLSPEYETKLTRYYHRL
jgi:hypothetical protein